MGRIARSCSDRSESRRGPSAQTRRMMGSWSVIDRQAYAHLCKMAWKIQSVPAHASFAALCVLARVAMLAKRTCKLADVLLYQYGDMTAIDRWSSMSPTWPTFVVAQQIKTQDRRCSSKNHRCGGLVPNTWAMLSRTTTWRGRTHTAERNRAGYLSLLNTVHK